MGEKEESDTTIMSLAVSRSKSLRTTMPIYVARQLGLEKGSRIKWSFDKIGDEWVAIIRKAPDSTEPNKRE